MQWGAVNHCTCLLRLIENRDNAFPRQEKCVNSGEGSLDKSCPRVSPCNRPRGTRRANAWRRMLDLLGISRGGMAEWSMAVVLKTSPDRLFQDGYFFPPNFVPTCATCGQILRYLCDLPANSDNRFTEFRP